MSAELIQDIAIAALATAVVLLNLTIRSMRRELDQLENPAPEFRCPFCGSTERAKRYGPRGGTWRGNPCFNPWHNANELEAL